MGAPLDHPSDGGLQQHARTLPRCNVVVSFAASRHVIMKAKVITTAKPILFFLLVLGLDELSARTRSRDTP